MAVSFEEWVGSPRAAVNRGRFTGTRVFKVNWSDTVDFMVELLGGYKAVGNTYVYVAPSYFPGVSQAICTDAEFDPFPEGEDGKIVTPCSTDLLTSTNQPPFAKVTAHYEILESANGQNRRTNTPDAPAGTFCTVTRSIGSETLTIPGRSFKWSGTSEQLSPDIVPGLLVPSQQITVTWERVPVSLIPQAEIQRQAGRVNASEYARFAIGTLLFLGADETSSYQITGDVLATLSYKFSATARQPTNTSTTTPFGWNYLYKEKARLDANGEHWNKIVTQDSSSPPFREDGNFALLTQFVT